ncbi:hypothetical protein GCM10020000_78350 [Streptomyces olivoverticillatus]
MPPPAPRQAAPSTPVPSRTPFAWLAPALLLLGFAAYPVTAVLRRGPVMRPIRWLSGLGLVAVVGAVACPLAVFAIGDGAVAPVVYGRPAGWLVVQVLGVAVVATACMAMTALWRARRTLDRVAWLRLSPGDSRGSGIRPLGAVVGCAAPLAAQA